MGRCNIFTVLWISHVEAISIFGKSQKKSSQARSIMRNLLFYLFRVKRAILEPDLFGPELSWKLAKVLMATNCINILDQALLRPDQIDRKIEFPNPNEESRFNILKIHSRKMKLMRGIDLKKISEKMNGASGAELNQMGQTLKSIGSL